MVQRVGRGITLLFYDAALEGGEWSAARPGRILPPRKIRYPLYKRLGGSHGRSGQVRKISPQPGFDPRTVHPVAIRYTDLRYPAHSLAYCTEFFVLIAHGQNQVIKASLRQLCVSACVIAANCEMVCSLVTRHDVTWKCH